MNWATKVKRVKRYEVVAWSNAEQRVTDRIPVADRGEGLEMVTAFRFDPLRDGGGWLVAHYDDGSSEIVERP